VDNDVRETYCFFLPEMTGNILLQNYVILRLSNSRRPVRQGMGSFVCIFVGKQLRVKKDGRSRAGRL